MLEPIYIGEPMDVTVDGLRVRDTGEYVNDATITAQVKTTAGAAVGSSVSVPYVADSSGDYLGTIPAATTVQLSRNTNYDVWVTASDGSVYRVIRYKATYRGER